MTEIADKIKGFISEEIMFESGADGLTDETPLLGGIMDSLGLMQLVSYIEDEFDVTIDDSDVTVTNFRTLADIERLVSEKVKAA